LAWGHFFSDILKVCLATNLTGVAVKPNW